MNEKTLNKWRENLINNEQISLLFYFTFFFKLDNASKKINLKKAPNTKKNKYLNSSIYKRLSAGKFHWCRRKRRG
jgi:hypothetical protein